MRRRNTNLLPTNAIIVAINNMFKLNIDRVNHTLSSAPVLNR
ncbi:hypothetical protein VCR14J2_300624 [Vibrio coralliirubri]|nr:hypothetical protein VCR14J2_300624 [Vibrio coralliirubri]